MSAVAVVASEISAKAATAIAVSATRGGLGPITHSVIRPSLRPFAPGALGNFPYYWQDPRTLEFNAKTYHWIDSCLRAGPDPVRLGQPFTNSFISVFSTIGYSLSSQDQAKLNQAHANTLNQQFALLTAWKQAFGSLPQGAGQPIDALMHKITHAWATPSTSLQELQSSPQVSTLLNSMPPSGSSVLPALTNYLNAFSSSLSLLNSTTKNNGYLRKALSAVQNPSMSNGGIQLNDGSIVPGFTISTPLHDILTSLNTSNARDAVKVRCKATGAGNEDCIIKVKGQQQARGKIDDFLHISTPECDDLLGHHAHSLEGRTDVKLSFGGITMVHFGPTDFAASTAKNWYWPTPIRQAVIDANRDVSGFKFSPSPSADFSETGSFGFINAIAISKNPHISIAATGPQAKSIAAEIRKNPQTKLRVLGVPLTEDGTMSHSAAAVMSKTNTVNLNFKPSAPRNGDGVDSTAFVLGVQTEYPIAAASRAIVDR